MRSIERVTFQPLVCKLPRNMRRKKEKHSLCNRYRFVHGKGCAHDSSWITSIILGGRFGFSSSLPMSRPVKRCTNSRKKVTNNDN